MLHPSYIELSKSAYEKNIDFLRKFAGEEVTISSVIKGNAYGHGIEQFVPMAEDCGIKHFSVFSADEANRALLSSQSDADIMIMGWISNDELPWAIENEVSFYVFEADRLRAAAEVASNLGKPARIHLQVETGMHRIGLEADQLEEAVSIIRDNRSLFSIEGICTHYAGAESVSNYLRIQNQIKTYRKICDDLRKDDIKPTYHHTACSAATLTYPETIMDLVRIGIAQYGFWPSRETFMYYQKNNHHPGQEEFKDPLNRVMTWKSIVMSTKEVEAGAFVGYGNEYLTNRKQQIANIPIGYAHGFARNLSNLGMVLINGARAKVAGRVNMNQLTIDVTDIPDVKKGDEVVVIGHQKDQEISVSSFSDLSNNLNYEALTRIPSELPRYVVE